MFSAVGKQIPANCTALGKALLCEHTLDEIKALFKDGLPKMTEHSVADAEQLYQQTKMVRKTQIAREKEENYQFIQCLAGLFQTPEEIRHTRIVLVDEIMAHSFFEFA